MQVIMQERVVASRIRGLSVMNFHRLRCFCEPALRRLFHLYFRFARGMTLGVRGVVLDADNRVFLVKHGYVAGWHLPGGGVEVGETSRMALQRELIEEGRIEIHGEPALHGIFFNSHVSPRDHVDCGFFAVDALPAETTAGTRLRIAEVLHHEPPVLTWRR
jgi:8-oxo-dGTP pyrophosphatase MutT (NUDIX family)